MSFRFAHDLRIRNCRSLEVITMQFAPET